MANIGDFVENKDKSIIDDYSEKVNVVESLCMHCHMNGTTTLLPIKIPYFRDIVICSFDCPHCDYHNNEVMSLNEISEKGVRIEVKITHESAHEDLNRQVIRNNTASVIIPHLQLEIPPNPSKNGDINTIEGFIQKAIEDLGQDQSQRYQQFPELADKMAEMIAQLSLLIQGSTNFSFIIDDPIGQSFIQNPKAPMEDKGVNIIYYNRTIEQNKTLGIESNTENSSINGKSKPISGQGIQASSKIINQLDNLLVFSKQHVAFSGTCHGCHNDCETRMCLTTIPLFKEIIIMVTDCDHCGLRHCEVKPGGGISFHGSRIILNFLSKKDLNRDLLKTDTASVMIPELELSLAPGTLGGKFTTIEGIISDIKEQLSSIQPFSIGDSSKDENRQKFQQFLNQLDTLIEGNTPFTFILDDPAGNSDIQKFSDKDAQITTEYYERTFEQNEELGLNDIKTENY